MVRSLADVRLHLVHWNLRVRLRSRVVRRPGLVRLGSEQCGWWVPDEAATAGTVAYCAGAGEDISFDLALLDRGCVVRTFDPTPRAIAHVEALGVEDPSFAFIPVGWWTEPGELRFYLPRDGRQPDLSLVNLQGTAEFVYGKVDRVATLMAELGDARVDVVKLDIEGAEYAVLDDLLRNGPLPAVLCVEFDQPAPPARTIDMVDRLDAAGYELARIDFFNYTFIREG